MITPPDIAAVRAAARAGDYERYLAALLAPADLSVDLMALAAFSGELARIPAVVIDPLMGEIRLQWWRDVITGAGGSSKTGNPVADALLDAIARHDLDRASLGAMIEARSFDLYPDPMPDEAAFRGYLGKRDGEAFALAARVLGGAPSPGTGLARCCEKAGFAVGATRVLAELALAASRGRIPLPVSRIVASGARLEDLLAGTLTPQLRGLIEGVVADIRMSLAEARALHAELPRNERSAFLSLALVEPYLRVLGKQTFDPLRQVAEVGPLSRVARIWWAHATRRV